MKSILAVILRFQYPTNSTKSVSDEEKDQKVNRMPKLSSSAFRVPFTSLDNTNTHTHTKNAKKNAHNTAITFIYAIL